MSQNIVSDNLKDREIIKKITYKCFLNQTYEDWNKWLLE